MKTITIEIDEKYAEILTITAIGRSGSVLNASTHACNLSKTSHIKIDENGKVWRRNEQRDAD